MRNPEVFAVVLPQLSFGSLGLRAHLAMAHIPNLETWDFLCFQRHLIQISGKDTFPASPFMCRRRVTWFSISYSGLVVVSILCVTKSPSVIYVTTDK